MLPSYQLLATVNKIHQEAAEVLCFELAAAGGESLPTFDPGSHIDVHMLPGLVRQYSLCNSADRPTYLIAVKKEVRSRGGSLYMHERVKSGDSLTIGLPRSNFALDLSARSHLLLAGGIGITPLLSMARHLSAAGLMFQLHYFARSTDHAAFYNLLSSHKYRGRVFFHFALEGNALRMVLRELLCHRPEREHLYLCGPRPFMDLVQEEAAENRWPPSSVHIEHFGADPASLAGSRSDFSVHLARSGGTYSVSAERTIVEALGEHGVRIETSCVQGVCGTCVVGLLQGEPDHRDVYLTDEEKRAGRRIVTCVSRAKSALLVLDL